MPKGLPQNLGTWMAQVERKLDNLSSGNRLDHASLDGTTLYLKGDGELGRIGRQPDGSNGVHIAKVQPPPQLTAPILTVGEQAGTCLVEWDGGTFDGRRMPLIHGHTEIWAELVGADWSPTVAPGDMAKRVGTIRDRTGGEVVVALPQAGTWAVWLRAMGADRETAGPWSPVSTVEITPLVDTEAIEQELDEARDTIAEADQRLTEGQGELDGKLDVLDERVGPGVDGTSSLTEALSTGLTDVYADAQAYAESQASNAVSQAAADAQSEYDRLEEIAERALSRAGDNVLEDPSFETDYWPNEWDGNGGFAVSRSSEEARTGDYQLRVSGAGATDLDFASVDVEPAMSYRLGIYWATLGYGSSGNAAWLVFRDTDTGDDLVVSEPMGTSGYWSRVHVMLEVPEGTMSITPALRVDHADDATLILEDASLREVGAAAEALRAAEQARHEAQQAHERAGDAFDTAASAYDAASSKSTVHWSLSAPSGTADNSDDVWWQYELRDGKRVVVGQWFWDDGVWREAEIAEEWLPLVNIGTGTYGDLSGDRLTSASVETRHLAVGDFENYLPEDALWDLRDEWTTSPLWRDRSQSANGFTTITDQGGMPVALRWNGPVPENSGDARLEFRPGGRGMPVRPGDQVKLAGYGWRATGDPGDIGVRFALRNEDGGLVTWRPSSTGHVFESGWNDFEMQATVPDIDEIRFATIDFYGQADSNRGHWGNFELRRMGQGKFIADGTIQSRSVDTEEFFSAVAVIEKIWTEIVRAKMVETEGLITEDMIATGAITTPKLTVTEEMVGEVARLLRIEAGSLASNDIEAMRIVSSLIEATTYLIHNADGDVSVRLDGMDNYLAGRLHAGMTESEGIVLDWGEKVRYSGLTEEGDPAPDRTIRTPYLNFHTDDTSYLTGREPSIHLDRDDPSGRSGMMVINPGYPVGTDTFRGKLNVVGDVQANRTEAREWSIARNGFNIPNSNPDLNTTISQESSTGNTYLLGRHHGASQSRARDSFWSSSQYSLAAGGRRRRVFTWGAPPPTGLRQPLVSVHLTQSASDRWAYVVANTSHVNATGYNINEHNPSSEYADYYVQQLGVWV